MNIDRVLKLNEKRLATLHPHAWAVFERFIDDMAKDWDIRIFVTDALRTYAKQQELYNIGRETQAKIVTNAKPGQSWHNFGRAIDVAFYKNGQITWNGMENEVDLWAFIGGEAGKRGITWSGNWTGFSERCHFEYTQGETLDEMRKGEDQ